MKQETSRIGQSDLNVLMCRLLTCHKLTAKYTLQGQDDPPKLVRYGLLDCQDKRW